MKHEVEQTILKYELYTGMLAAHKSNVLRFKPMKDTPENVIPFIYPHETDRDKEVIMAQEGVVLKVAASDQERRSVDLKMSLAIQSYNLNSDTVLFIIKQKKAYEQFIQDCQRVFSELRYHYTFYVKMRNVYQMTWRDDHVGSYC